MSRRSLRRHDPDQLLTVGAHAPSQPVRSGSRVTARMLRARSGRLRARCTSSATPRPAAGRWPTCSPAALRGGVDVFQLRMKDAARRRRARAPPRSPATLCASAGALVHPQRPARPRRARGRRRRHVGQDDSAGRRGARESSATTGSSASRRTRPRRSTRAASGADYIGVGPVHATPTKPGRPAVGLELVRHAAAHARRAVVRDRRHRRATRRAPSLDAGARRIVVVRAIAEARRSRRRRAPARLTEPPMGDAAASARAPRRARAAAARRAPARRAAPCATPRGRGAQRGDPRRASSRWRPASGRRRHGRRGRRRAARRGEPRRSAVAGRRGRGPAASAARRRLLRG